MSQVPENQVYERILLAAVKLFQVKGYHATSVREIGEKAGVSQSSLYYHARNKLQILVDLNQRFMGRLTPALAKITERDAPADSKIVSIIEQFMTVISQHQGEVTAVLHERRSLPNDVAAELQGQRDNIDAMIDEVIRAGIAEGAFAKVNVTLARLALTGMVNWAYEWYQPGGALDPKTISTAFGELLLNGLRTR